MKLTLILDYMAANELRLPSNNWIKQFSHNLLKLLESVQAIEKRVSPKNGINAILDTQCLEYDLFAFLNNFAKTARYANLDKLTGSSTVDDPLEKWQKLTLRVFESDVPKNLKNHLDIQTIEITKLLSPNSIVDASDLENKSLSVSSAWWTGSMFNMVAPFMIWRIMKILYPIYKVLDNVSGLARSVNLSLYSYDEVVPVMYEFFYDFISGNQGEVLDVDEWLHAE